MWNAKSLVRGLLAALFLVGIMAIAAPQAQAAHVQVTCDVDGDVELDPGLQPGPTLSPVDVDFIDTELECDGQFGSTAVDATYSVSAGGDSSQNCAAGTGSGSITATKISGTGPATVTGTYDFVRAGTHVNVTGELSANNESGTLVAELEFIPAEGDCVNTPITAADLVGEAVIAHAA